MMPNELPKRKPTRWNEIDYSTEGLYFITICTQNRQCILSEVVGDIPLSFADCPVGGGFPLPRLTPQDNLSTVGEGFPLPRLTPQGDITKKYIEKISEKYPHISVDNYVIMPNHIHLILIVGEHDGRGNPSPTISSVIGWLKYQITKEINLGKHNIPQKIFQRSFFDHVIRNGQEYAEISKYVAKNPQTWREDSLYCEGNK